MAYQDDPDVKCALIHAAVALLTSEPANRLANETTLDLANGFLSDMFETIDDTQDEDDDAPQDEE